MKMISNFLVLVLLCMIPTLAISENSTKDVVYYRNDSVLSQFVDGAGWKMSINLVNIDTTAATFQLILVSDTGNLLNLPLTADASFTTSNNSINGSIPVGGSITFSTAGTASQLTQGWAIMGSSQRVAGQAVFQRAISGLPNVEAVVPFTSVFDIRQVMPFDNTGGLQQGIAIANVATSTNNLTITIRNAAGVQLTQSNLSLPSGNHTAFLLSQNYPQTANQRGVIEITSTGGTLGTTTGIGVGIVGLRGNAAGSLTTVLSEVSPDWITQR